ncbi:MAG: arginine repressor [Bacteroidetes bacterium]|nr:arginine repressor [Bacteroidota bacterium]MCW5896110.1 arginine repressor [Bacteroidota bacterium]
MNKGDIHKRHAAIKSLISSKDISNQTELVKDLKAKKIDVTQATLSRDLAELGIIRMPTEHGYRYEIRTASPEPVLRGFTAEEVISVDSNENLIVIKTFPGRAQGVAFLLDSKRDPEILGTIAGDDTIVVIPKSIKRIKKTINNISHYLGLS